MNRIKLTLLLLLTSNLIIYSQQIPNGNFEDWNNSHDPVGWNLVDVFGIYSAEETSDNIQGLKAVKLENQELFGGFLLPGIISLGQIDLANQQISGGIPFTARPTGLSYFFKYLPQGGDTCFTASLLTKWNTTTNSTDTIASTGYFTSENFAEYTQVSVPYIYMSQEMPDTMNVAFLASNFTGTTGTSLFVDSLSVLYNTVVSPTLCFPAIDTSSTYFTAAWLEIPDASSYSIDVSENIEFSTYVSGFEDFDVGNTSTYNVNVSPSLYFYRARVHFGTETGLNSNKIAVPMPVECIAATNISQTSFTANWQSANNASNYFLDVSTVADFSSYVGIYENYNVGTSLNENITGLDLNTEYFYRIRTEYGSYLSQNSNTTTVLTEPSAISRVNHPKRVNVFSQGNKIIVNSENKIVDKIYLYDVQGKIIKSRLNSSKDEIFYLENSGTYFIKIIIGSDIISKKVIVFF